MEQILLNGINLNELLGHFGRMIDDKLAGLNKSENTQPEYMSRKEVAEMLKISLPTLNEWSKAGLITSSKVRNRVLYKRDDINIALETVSTHKYKKGAYHNG